MLCCAVLCCAVLCCAVLCCAVLCCAVQQFCCFLYQTLVVPFGESYLDWNETYISVFYMVAGAEVRGSTTLCGANVGGYVLYICMYVRTCTK